MSEAATTCGKCGAWRAAGPPRCACGWDPGTAWRDAVTSLLAMLVVAGCIAPCVWLGRGLVYAFLVWPVMLAVAASTRSPHRA